MVTNGASTRELRSLPLIVKCNLYKQKEGIWIMVVQYRTSDIFRVISRSLFVNLKKLKISKYGCTDLWSAWSTKLATRWSSTGWKRQKKVLKAIKIRKLSYYVHIIHIQTFSMKFHYRGWYSWWKNLKQWFGETINLLCSYKR